MIAPCRRPPAGKMTQQGAALIVTALLMLVISLLALAALTRSNLDERMAFNQRDRQVALQAAEAAIRAAEKKIDTKFKPLLDELFFMGTDQCADYIDGDRKGWCDPKSDSNGWSSLNWANGPPSNTLTLDPDQLMEGVSFQPHYLIEYRGSEDRGGPNPGPCLARFLITARGFGLNSNSNVTLQTLVQYSFGNCQRSM